MQHSPTDIKDRLLRGLDEEYNVVDMGVVAEVISILEKMPITKEALEVTRLGKCVNLLRKKTDCESLAKRAKNLVKRWRNLVDLSGASQQNGAAVEKSVNPHEPLVESVPRTHAANKRLRKAEDDSCETYEPQKKKSRINGLTRSQPVIANAEGECSRREEPVPVEYFPPAEVQVPQDPPMEPPPGPKKRGRKKGSKNRSTLLKAAGTVPVDDDPIKEKIASISRTPKVKTTQELVAMLGSKTGELDVNVVPKDRSSSLKNSLKKDQSLSSKYLSQEDIPSTPDKPSSPIIIDNDSPTIEKLEPPPEDPPPIPPPKFNTVEEILSQLPPIDIDAISWDETPVPSPPASPVVTVDDLERLHGECVEGLNGVWEHSAPPAPPQSETFREWQEMVHRRSYHNDLLRILPYTVID
nr:PREDICTED: mediator of RNA polymerase II transcription subunit 26 [Bemisia tabaci]